MFNLPADRHQSATEEAANSISHAIGFVLAAAALPLLVQTSLARGGPVLPAVGLGVFAATMMLLYLSSALCHGLPPGRGKRFFDKLDHAAIFLFIAGSHTAFGAAALPGGPGWPSLALVWALALLGAAVKLSNALRHRAWSTALYVATGWVALLAALPWIRQGSPMGMRLLLAGGLAYTLGAGLFMLSARMRYAHLLWHLLVMVGSGLHVAAALQQT